MRGTVAKKIRREARRIASPYVEQLREAIHLHREAAQAAQERAANPAPTSEEIAPPASA